MPLPMQGDKLLPGHQNIVGPGPRPRTPDRGGGYGGRNAVHHCREVAAGELGLERLGIERGRMGRTMDRTMGRTMGRTMARTMGGDVDQRTLEPLGIAMPEFERGEFLEVVVQQPGMIERRL